MRWANFGADPFFEVDPGAQVIGSVNWYIYKNHLPIERILSAPRVAVIAETLTLPGGMDPVEKIYRLDPLLKKGNWYAALVDYTAGSDSQAYIQLGHDYDSGPLYIAWGYLPSQVDSRRLPVVFGPVAADVVPAFLRVVNMSSASDVTITRMELLDLGPNPVPDARP